MSVTSQVQKGVSGQESRVKVCVLQKVDLAASHSLTHSISPLFFPPVQKSKTVSDARYSPP